MNLLERIGPVFIVLAAAVIGVVLLSQKWGVNLFHHHTVSMPGKYSVECTGYVTKTCQVNLTNEIGDVGDYKGLLSFFYSAKPSDKIYVYLAGNGGTVEGSLALYAAIKKSPAKTVTVVSGDVYSGHAYISLAGNSGVKIGAPYFIIMFHRSSLYSIYNTDKYCEQTYSGRTDRRQSMVDKCKVYMNAFTYQDKSFIINEVGKVLTAIDVRRMLEGHDVILTGKEVQDRLDGTVK